MPDGLLFTTHAMDTQGTVKAAVHLAGPGRMNAVLVLVTHVVHLLLPVLSKRHVHPTTAAA